MVNLSEIREFHVLMFAVQVALAVFTATTGFIDISYGQSVCGGLGVAATPILLWMAYRHHRRLRSM